MRESITSRAHGIDISRYQIQFNNPPVPDLGYHPERTYGQVDFVIVKVGEGLITPYTNDYEFNLLWDGASTFDIRGWYFYQRYGKAYSWEAQAVGVLEYYRKASVKPHMLWNDVEKINNTNFWGGFDTSFFADSKRIMDLWKKELPDVLIGNYSNPDVINNYVIPNAGKKYGKQWLDEFMAYPQWVAQYWIPPSPDKNPTSYIGYPDWKIYQYTEEGDSRTLIDGHYWRRYGSSDLDVFNGTIQEMREWLGIDNVAPPPIVPPVVTPNQIDSMTVTINGKEEKYKP